VVVWPLTKKKVRILPKLKLVGNKLTPKWSENLEFRDPSKSELDFMILQQLEPRGDKAPLLK
jgi:hypothetical protein